MIVCSDFSHSAFGGCSSSRTTYFCDSGMYDYFWDVDLRHLEKRDYSLMRHCYLGLNGWQSGLSSNLGGGSHSQVLYCFCLSYILN